MGMTVNALRKAGLCLSQATVEDLLCSAVCWPLGIHGWKKQVLKNLQASAGEKNKQQFSVQCEKCFLLCRILSGLETENTEEIFVKMEWPSHRL